MESGTVRWYDEVRGFGLITPDAGGEDVFCHYSAILQDGCFRSVGEGQRVEYEVTPGPEGPVAAEVRRVFDETGKVAIVLCGDAVQIRTRTWGRANLAAAAEKMGPFGEVRLTPLLVRLRAPPHELTLFDDGRAIVKGTNDVALARDLVTTWLGIRLPAE